MICLLMSLNALEKQSIISCKKEVIFKRQSSINKELFLLERENDTHEKKISEIEERSANHCLVVRTSLGRKLLI